MTSLAGGQLRKVDLAHGDDLLCATGVFDLRHSMVTMTIRDPDGISFLLDSVLDRTTTPTTTVPPVAGHYPESLRLTPRGWRPEPLSPPEFPPSNLLFGVDRRHGVAAAAPLAFDRDHRSHQWLPCGDAWRPHTATLVMDPANADDTPSPHDAYITVAQLREVVTPWAWGDDLPPAGVDWRSATEREVRWSRF